MSSITATTGSFDSMPTFAIQNSYTEIFILLETFNSFTELLSSGLIHTISFFRSIYGNQAHIFMALRYYQWF